MASDWGVVRIGVGQSHLERAGATFIASSWCDLWMILKQNKAAHDKDIYCNGDDDDDADGTGYEDDNDGDGDVEGDDDDDGGGGAQK